MNKQHTPLTFWLALGLGALGGVWSGCQRFYQPTLATNGPREEQTRIDALQDQVVILWSGLADELQRRDQRLDKQQTTLAEVEKQLAWQAAQLNDFSTRCRCLTAQDSAATIGDPLAPISDPAAAAGDPPAVPRKADQESCQRQADGSWQCPQSGYPQNYSPPEPTGTGGDCAGPTGAAPACHSIGRPRLFPRLRGRRGG